MLTAGALERAYEDIIRQTVEGVVLTSLHPRTSIMVIVQVRHEQQFTRLFTQELLILYALLAESWLRELAWNAVGILC